MSLKGRAYARAGLIGNPSDGYFGKTVSLIVKNFKAEVVLQESDELVIEPQSSDLVRFGSAEAFIAETQRFGYYGGMRLLKAAIRVFWRYCRSQDIALSRNNFTLAYESNIPRLVGLAGSSALVIACLRALMAFYDVAVPAPILANIALAAERDELGINAGLQDRVIQAYEGVIFMDFDRDVMKSQGYGRYHPIEPHLLPPLYIAYDAAQAEGSERTHNDLRARFETGDTRIIDVMGQLAELAEEGTALLQAGRSSDIKPLINRSFDLRREICPISRANLTMIETARSVGASSQFAGSGGAIIGTYEDEAMYRRLERALGDIGCTLFKPMVA